MRWLYCFGALVSLFLILPVMIVLPMSFSSSPSFEFPPPGYWLGYYVDYFNNQRWLGSTFNSLIIGLFSSLITLIIVIPASFALVRFNFKFKYLISLLVIMPLTVPHIVMALGYYYYLGELGIIHTRIGVIIAHTCLCIPISYLIISATVKGFDENLEKAAINLGASPVRAFLDITFPVLRPGFISAALFAFLYSFDEAVVAIFISGRDSSTLPRLMFDSLRMQPDPVISVVSSLIILSIVIMLAIYIIKDIRKTKRQLP